MGISQSLETIASQANGAKEYKRVGLIFHKTIVINLFIDIFVACFLFFLEDILMIFYSKEDYKMCHYAG